MIEANLLKPIWQFWTLKFGTPVDANARSESRKDTKIIASPAQFPTSWLVIHSFGRCDSKFELFIRHLVPPMCHRRNLEKIWENVWTCPIQSNNFLIFADRFKTITCWDWILLSCSWMPAPKVNKQLNSRLGKASIFVGTMRIVRYNFDVNCTLQSQATKFVWHLSSPKSFWLTYPKF